MLYRYPIKWVSGHWKTVSLLREQTLVCWYLFAGCSDYYVCLAALQCGAGHQVSVRFCGAGHYQSTSALKRLNNLLIPSYHNIHCWPSSLTYLYLTLWSIEILLTSLRFHLQIRKWVFIDQIYIIDAKNKWNIYFTTN